MIASTSVDCISFEEALERTKAISSQGQPTLLLGNGFGIAYDANIFSYKALFNSVDWSNTERLQRVFEQLKTWDFESIRNLDIAAEIADIYELVDIAQHNTASTMLRDDADFLKDALIRAIQETHPAHIFQVASSRLKRTAKFLRNFGRLFTLSYDLLLYWTLVQPDTGMSGLFTDGFRKVESVLEWTAFPNLGVLYLHGALHLFQQNGRLEKIKYQAITGGRLIQQIEERIANGQAPLFVCEGTNAQKLTHIQRSTYLRHCFHAFQNTAGVLFIYGLSLGDSDQHLLDAISQSSISHIFISLYGDPNSPHNQWIQHRAQTLPQARYYRKLAIDFYDAASAELW
jgi:hypothetical protein